MGPGVSQEAGETQDGQAEVKRVVAEMGGKNCVIVDSDADLDEAVPGIVESAFGYAGQKCSAAARVLVHEAAADTLLERLAGAVRVIDVGQAERFATEVPPVIEQEAKERVERYAARPDSGGPGYHRGGCGVVRDVRVLCERAELATRMENTMVAPYGVAGGHAGVPMRIRHDADQHVGLVLCSARLMLG